MDYLTLPTRCRHFTQPANPQPESSPVATAGHYHCEVKIISRSAGHSAVAAAAYRAREKLLDERSGLTHNYTPKKDLEHKEIIAPAGAAGWVFDRGKLWNTVEGAEKRKDSQLAREVVVSLPRDLSKEARAKLVRHFVTNQFVSLGMVADFSIHCPRASDGKEYPHAHILLTMRSLNAEGFGLKEREWNTAVFTLDDRIKDKSKLRDLRENWQEYTNQALSDSGSKVRIDHRSYAERGIEVQPRPYMPKNTYCGHKRTGQETPGFIQWQRDSLSVQAKNIGQTIDHSRQGYAHRSREAATEDFLLRRKKSQNQNPPISLTHSPERQILAHRYHLGLLNKLEHDIDR